MMWCDFLVHILADAAFLLLTLAAGWLIFRLPRRRALFRFFGTTATGRLVIYLSNIRVTGSLDAHGVARSFQGSTVSFRELSEASAVERLFRYPLQASSEDGSFLARVLLADVAVQIRLAPLNVADFETSAPVVAVGGSPYNLAAERIETQIHAAPRFATTGDAIQIQGLPPITDPASAFCARMVEPGTGRALFYVAGLSEPGTGAATAYLCREWRRIQKRHPQGSFVILLRLDPLNLSCTVVAEQPL